MKSLSGVITSPVLVCLHSWEMDSCAQVSVSQLVTSVLAADVYDTNHSALLSQLGVRQYRYMKTSCVVVAFPEISL